MQIPKSFELGKNKWAVRYYGDSAVEYGRVFPKYKVVRVNVSSDGKNRTTAQRSETFWHEVTHAILHDMKDPRWNDEKFVTAFSKRLNQVINTAVL
jgi:hypothetical protein